jgi:hypothetical protein
MSLFGNDKTEKAILAVVKQILTTDQEELVVLKAILKQLQSGSPSTATALKVKLGVAVEQ